MAVSKETLKKLLQGYKLPADVIAKAVDTDEEVAVELPDVKVFTPEEYSQLETNLKEQGKGAYTKAGKEIAIKELKEKTGLDFDGKDADTFLEKYKEHVIAEAKLKPDDAKVQWEKDKKMLQDQISEWKTKHETLESKARAVEYDAKLLKSFPAERNTLLNDEDRLLLIKNRMEVKNEDGKEIVYYKGNKLQDHLTNPLSFTDAIKHVFDTEKWTEPAGGGARGGGRGAGDGTGKSVFATLKDFNSHIQSKGIHAGSEEARRLFTEAQKANPDMDLSVV